MSVEVTIPRLDVPPIDMRTGRLTREWANFLQKLFNRTGGSTVDLIASSQIRELFPWREEPQDRAFAFQLDQKEDAPNFVSASAAYTAVGGDIVSATRGATITLPAQPLGGEKVSIRNGDGSFIKINPGAKTINGKPSIATMTKGTLLDLMYDLNEWVIT